MIRPILFANFSTSASCGSCSRVNFKTRKPQPWRGGTTSSGEEVSCPSFSDRGARAIRCNVPLLSRSIKTGTCALGNSVQSLIFATKLEVVNVPLSLASSRSAHIRADVKECGPGLLVVPPEDVAPRYSKHLVPKCRPLPRSPA